MFKKITLPNGLRVLHVPQKGAKAVTVLVLVEAGSKYETKEVNGISHFLEHLMFKGTKKRPTPLIIATELDRIGGQSNAFTSHEYTGYWAKADAGHLDNVLDVISDVFLNSLFDEKEMEKEKGVIIEEMNMYYDQPQQYVWDLWTGLLYGDQPAGWPIIGTKETISNMKRDEIVKYVEDHYLAGKTVVVVAGDASEEILREKVEKYFAHIPTTPGKGKLSTKEEQEKPGVRLHFKNTDQTHAILGVRAFNAFDERKYKLEVLNTILGVGMSSRLFQILRVELGAAYYVRSGTDLFTDHGYLAASGGFDHRKVEEVIRTMVREFQRLAKEPVPEEELAKARDHICGALVLNTETTDDLASFYGPQEILTQEIATPEEFLAKIRTVTAQDIQKVAEDIIRED
ncbi:MAG: insulinase family protein, partial [Parcubacteria group bacterium]|nr:insulinase family protein [Parcubacteria group bacterium]